MPCANGIEPLKSLTDLLMPQTPQPKAPKHPKCLGLAMRGHLHISSFVSSILLRFNLY